MLMDGMSMDLEQANMDKLRSVFPECFAEGTAKSTGTALWRCADARPTTLPGCFASWFVMA